MSNKVTVAAIQMTYGLEEACEKVREAASQGRRSFCCPNCLKTGISVRKKLRELPLATTLEENPAVREMQTIARDFKVVIPVSYYERVGETTFNTVAVIDATARSWVSIARPTFRMTILSGKVLFYARKYRLQGLGYAYAKIGVGICWDQCSRSPRAAWRCRHGTAVLPDRHRFRADSRLRFHAALAALHAGSRGGEHYAADRGKPHRHRNRQADRG